MIFDIHGLLAVFRMMFQKSSQYTIVDRTMKATSDLGSLLSNP